MKSISENEEKYAQIVRTRRGGYELLFPTKLNEELKPHMGKDFDMDVSSDNGTLNIVLTRKLSPTKKKPTPKHPDNTE